MSKTDERDDEAQVEALDVDDDKVVNPASGLTNKQANRELLDLQRSMDGNPTEAEWEQMQKEREEREAAEEERYEESQRLREPGAEPTPEPEGN